MTVHFFILDTKKETENGFPVVIRILNKGKQKQKVLFFSKVKYFDKNLEVIKDSHPDFETLAPMMLNIKIKARKLIFSGANDVNKLMIDLFTESKDEKYFSEYGKEVIAEMENLASKYGKNNNWKLQNKLLGNINFYKSALVAFNSYNPNLLISSLDYNLINNFKLFRIGSGNSKATVHVYLRTLRALYNKAVLQYKYLDTKPFNGVFVGLHTKSYSSKKKYILREDVFLLEQSVLQGASRRSIDLWLLCFYFGGCDLIDLYYLEKSNFVKDRVFFERSKTNNGLPIDLKIHPKAQKIIDKYSGEDAKWIFPWSKDKARYTTFRNNHIRTLKKVQSQLNIKVLPLGENLGIKVARHSFANIGKKMLIQEDLLRELMGHERNEVDNYYKDKYPEKVRDEALFSIISSFECEG